MAASKKTKKSPVNTKAPVLVPRSTNHMKVKWAFDEIDRAGRFSFDLHREDFDQGLVLQKIVDLGNRTWQELMQDTHDKTGHTCHHFLDLDGLSDEAKKRVALLVQEDDYDTVFSFRLTNLCRIIGLRKDDTFFVKWYDPLHEFYPSKHR